MKNVKSTQENVIKKTSKEFRKIKTILQWRLWSTATRSKTLRTKLSKTVLCASLTAVRHRKLLVWLKTLLWTAKRFQEELSHKNPKNPKRKNWEEFSLQPRMALKSSEKKEKLWEYQRSFLFISILQLLSQRNVKDWIVRILDVDDAGDRDVLNISERFLFIRQTFRKLIKQNRKTFVDLVLSKNLLKSLSLCVDRRTPLPSANFIDFLEISISKLRD